MRFLIDAGHNVNGDVGARGCGYKEEIETRRIVKELRRILNREGHSVVFCHPDVTTIQTQRKSLEGRVKKANEAGGDLFVSIHLNAFNSQAFGTEVYTYPNSKKAIEVAKRVHGKLDELFFGRGVKDNDSFYVLKHTRMEAILVEICFIDNKDDMTFYEKNFEKVVAKLASGLIGKDVTFHDNAIAPTGKTFRVISGSFQNRDNAVERMKLIEKELGIDCFIDEYDL